MLLFHEPSRQRPLAAIAILSRRLAACFDLQACHTEITFAQNGFAAAVWWQHGGSMVIASVRISSRALTVQCPRLFGF